MISGLITCDSGSNVLFLMFSCVILYIGVARIVGGSVTAAHQSAEGDGCHQPAAAARHLAEFHG